jgi:hypothetical protein
VFGIINKMIKKNKKSKMTIDKLAVIMKAGFNGVNKKIDHVEDLVDKLATSTLKGFEDVYKNINGVKNEVEGVKNQLQGTNKRIDDFAENKVSKTAFKELENRVGFIENKLEIKNS